MGFEQLAGQDLIITALQNAIRGGTLPHAILFTGPAGSGKSTVALLLTQALNCTGKPAPCGQCASCRSIVKGQHPDVAVIEQDGRRIRIDRLREVKNKFSFFSHGPGKRVCLIEDAHNLTGEAAASLLKILEEPPDRLVFILTTEYPSRLPATVISRCRQYQMKRLSNETMRNYLKEVNPEAGREEVNMAVSLGEGIPGRARDILINDEWRECRLQVHRLGKKIVCGDISEKELLWEAKKWTEGKDVSRLLELFSFFIKDGLFWSLCRDSDMLTDSEQQSFWETIAADASVMKDCLEILNNTRKMLQTNVNVLLALEAALLQIKGRFAECMM